MCKALSGEDKEENQNLKFEEMVTKMKNKYHKKKHKCSTCEKSFPSRAHLKEHEVSHSSVQQFQCSVCGQGFKRKNALSKHMRIFHPNGPHNVVCSCGKVFASRDLMEKHKENSGQHRLLVCGECGILYKTQASLDSHLLLHRESQTSEGIAWPYTCHTCQEKFSSRASLSNHTKEFHSISVFQCPECSKTCKTLKLLHLHRVRKHTAGDQQFLCPLCSKTFHILKDLRRHMQTHNPAGARECPVCHSKFKTDSTLRTHMKSHSKGKPYDCSICLFPFCSVEALTAHLQSYHSIEDVGSDFSETWNSKCLVCGQVFLRRSALAQHMRSHFDSQGTQLVVLEDTAIDITRNTLVREEQNEATQSLVQTRQITVNKGVVPSHQKPTQTEVESTKSKRESSLEGYRVTDSKHVPVTAEQSISANDELYESNSGKRTIIKGQNKEDRLSPYPVKDTAWQERSIQTLENSTEVVVEGLAASNSSAADGEETRYICEACSLVLTDMEQLKVHLLTCYKEDSSDECFVVFEVDDNKIQDK
ncbi:zinc finger protein 658B-like [Portunus trituberculatus]|uniref:zinc finger protein 658B-like n=1 Tax=Portunus trituberculatus TaxID=210409 RepID=UPI001E1D15AE|nr:zinc finger protein 658B-like [Portunus trituberculatus]